MAPGVVALIWAAPISGLTGGPQAAIWPVSVAKMNRAGALTVPLVSTNPVPGLLTCPVGTGIVTRTVGTLVAVVEPGADEYSVDDDVPLFDTHSGVVAPRERPHGLTRSSSCSEALPAWSETRLTCCTASGAWRDWCALAVAGLSRARPLMKAVATASGRPFERSDMSLSCR